MTDQTQNPDASADTLAPARRTNLLQIAGSGFLMGAADIVPGVSGGTVALILGIYERLLTAISRCDRDLLSMLTDRRWKAAAERIDLKFCIALGTGILTGAAGLATVMKHLLTEYRSLTYAAFVGMILASSILVARRVSLWRMQTYGSLLLGIIIALRLVTLPELQNPPDTYWYLFLCGMIGISAMILPGVSGAFLLLLLRRYDVVVDAIRSVVHGDISTATIATIAVFACGCLTGLLSFSRVLRWLLAHRHDVTMAMLCGFMIGSLYRLWPFQRDMSPEVEDIKHKVFEHYLPQGVTSHVVLAIVIVLASAGLILALDAIGRRSRSQHDSVS
jgi:putative membrane protein